MNEWIGVLDIFVWMFREVLFGIGCRGRIFGVLVCVVVLFGWV